MDANFDVNEQQEIESSDLKVEKESLKKVSFKDIFTLYFKPSKFLNSGLDLENKKYIILIIMLFGVDKLCVLINKEINRSGFGVYESMYAPFVKSWGAFWIGVLTIGFLSGVIGYYMSGIWCWLMMKWSCKDRIELKEARVINAWSFLIYLNPLFLLMCFATIMHSNFFQYYMDSNLIYFIILVFPFWRSINQYKMIKSKYDTKKWVLRTWFLIIPITLYALSVIGILFG